MAAARSKFSSSSALELKVPGGQGFSSTDTQGPMAAARRRGDAAARGEALLWGHWPRLCGARGRGERKGARASGAQASDGGACRAIRALYGKQRQQALTWQTISAQ